MKNKKSTSYKWAYLPLIFSSAAILSTQVSAGPGQSYPSGQQYQDARQVGSANYNYVGGRTQVGGHITDDGDISVDLNHAFRETENSSSSIGLWGGVDLDDGESQDGGAQLNHNWVSRDSAGNAKHVNKAFVAYDRNVDKHEKATVGYGQERENMFWEGHVSKGLSDKKVVSRSANGSTVSNKAYDYGVGGSVGTFLEGSNMRVRAGLDHEWGDDVGAGEKDAKNTTVSAGVEKFFQGTGHSVSLDVAASKKDGGTEYAGFDDTETSASLGYHYDFGGASIYQPDQRYRRVRVEVPGHGRPARYARKPIYKRVATYKNVPTYGKKTVKKPFKQLVKSTMELEGQTFFKKNSSKLIPSAKTRLNQIAQQIRSNGYRGAIRITGNTCGLGSVIYDQRLSEKRARAVRAYLISRGFKADTLIARGLGKGHPKYPNTPSQGFKNRRVDIEYVTERKSYKTGYRTEQQNVRTGTRRVATGFKNVAAGYKNVMIDSGSAGSPRVIWRTEAVKTAPAWIKRALHNNIKHDRSVNTYTTTTSAPIPPVIPVAPIAENDTRTVACSTDPVTIDVLGNDSGTNLSVSNPTTPQYGTVEVVNNQIVYTPNANGSGCGLTDTFSYTITDANGLTSTANVTINMAAADTDPVDPTDPTDPTDLEANNDRRSTECNSPITINALANDEGDDLKITDFSGVDNGTVKIVNNKLVFTPNSDACGTTEKFTYTIKDSNGNTDTATVTIYIEDAEDGNTRPTAVDDSVTTDMNEAISIKVLRNDSDPEDDRLRVIEYTQASNGRVSKGSNGKLIYTPNDGFYGEDSFEYTISDGNGGTDTATVTITVEKPADTNVKPIAVNDSVTAACSAITINVLDNDSDPDGDTLSILSISGASLGNAVISGNNIVYTPDSSCGPGRDKFSYTISDGHGHTASANVKVTIAPVPGCNTAKCTVAEADDVSTTEGTPVMINVLANDAGEGLRITDVDMPKHGTAMIQGSSIKYMPAAGFTGTDSFWYQVTDAKGYKDAALIVVYVEEATKCGYGSKCN